MYILMVNFGMVSIFLLDKNFIVLNFIILIIYILIVCLGWG